MNDVTATTAPKNVVKTGLTIIANTTTGVGNLQALKMKLAAKDGARVAIPTALPPRPIVSCATSTGSTTITPTNAANVLTTSVLTKTLIKQTPVSSSGQAQVRINTSLGVSPQSLPTFKKRL